MENETNADIRNKPQAAISAFELIKQQRSVPQKLADVALKDLEMILAIINEDSAQ